MNQYLFYSPINGEVASNFFAWLDSLPAEAELEVRINSPGGDVFSGITIHSRLSNWAGNVNVFVDGLAASIASVIACAGDRVTIAPGGMFMLHKPSLSEAGGNADDLRSAAEMLDQVQRSMLAVYAERMKISVEEINAILDSKTEGKQFITADMAVSIGLADEIAGAKVKIAAQLLTDLGAPSDLVAQAHNKEVAELLGCAGDPATIVAATRSMLEVVAKLASENTSLQTRVTEAEAKLASQSVELTALAKSFAGASEELTTARAGREQAERVILFAAHSRKLTPHLITLLESKPLEEAKAILDSIPEIAAATDHPGQAEAIGTWRGKAFNQLTVSEMAALYRENPELYRAMKSGR